MQVVTVTIFINPGSEQAFMDATVENARNTRMEPGNLRFDVLRGTDDPTRFLLYEVYQTTEDHARHRETAHYLKWRSTCEPLMSRPREGAKFNTIFYGDG